MINIVCLKWGNRYSSDYVNILYSGVKKNTTIPFNFICYTEDTAGILPDIETRPLPKDVAGLNGWWFKPYLFSNEAGLEGRVFYLDLDTIVTGNIDHMLQYNESPFVILHELGNLLFDDRPGRVNNFLGKFGSGLMSWDASWSNFIWEEFKSNARLWMKKFPGDQGFIEHIVKEKQPDNYKFFQDLWAGHVRSFKYECAKQLISDTRVVCFHGNPRPHESFVKSFRSTKLGQCPPASWVKEYWRV